MGSPSGLNLSQWSGNDPRVATGIGMGVDESVQTPKAPASKADTPILSGNGIEGFVQFVDAAAARRGGDTKVGDILLEVAQSRFDTLLRTIKNLAPSEQEIELREKAKAENLEQQRKLEEELKKIEETITVLKDDKVSDREKVSFFANVFSTEDLWAMKEFIETQISGSTPV